MSDSKELPDNADAAPCPSRCYSVADVIVEIYVQMPGEYYTTCWCRLFRLPCVPMVGDLIITNTPYLRVLEREFLPNYTNAAGIPYVTCECEAENICIDDGTEEELKDDGWVEYESAFVFAQDLSE